jgi:glycosyltransferase involved in cell wall biosynthesis
MLDLDILWWGRSDINYSRNRVIRSCLKRLGCRFSDFSPLFSPLGLFEAYVRRPPSPALIWVPCFRQRDMASASIWAKKCNVPLIFDPLISAYDKQVFERKKFPEGGKKAERLLQWERKLFQKASLVIGDTKEHCSFFHSTFDVNHSQLVDIPVGAEEKLFTAAATSSLQNDHVTVLFYGSFLGLQGPLTIIEAAQKYSGPAVQWKFIGDGPLHDECKKRAQGMRNIEFIPWVPYEDLPQHIQSADILLGIFGTSQKAHRVIPNKVYQTLACGKPLVTMQSPAYPDGFTTDKNLGIRWVKSGNAEELAAAISELAQNRELLEQLGQQAQKTFTNYFSEAYIERRLLEALSPFIK